MDAEQLKSLSWAWVSAAELAYSHLSGAGAQKNSNEARDELHTAIDAMQADIDRLRKDAISALAAGGVLIRLSRVEGYEDVCDELLVADAMEGINWPSYEVLTAEEAKGTT